jgi:hypothetical protein
MYSDKVPKLKVLAKLLAEFRAARDPPEKGESEDECNSNNWQTASSTFQPTPDQPSDAHLTICSFVLHFRLPRFVNIMCAHGHPSFV